MINLRYDFIYHQEQDYIPILKMHYELFTKSFYGKTVELAIVFNPVDMPSEKETAEVAKIWSDVAGNYVFLKVYCTYGTTGINYRKDELEESANGKQYIFNRETLYKDALEAAMRANKGNLKGIQGVRNLFAKDTTQTLENEKWI